MTSSPLTAAELHRLDHLVRRAAAHLTPDERGPLLRLWEHHRRDYEQAHAARAVLELLDRSADDPSAG